MKPRIRDELKFLISHETRSLLLSRWSRHLRKDQHTDEYAVQPVLSLYYDSPDLCFYEQKLAGIGHRNKVRLRTYGTRFEDGKIAFLEIKQRIWDRVRKIRQPLPQFKRTDLDSDNWRFDNPVHESAFRSLQHQYRLRPSAQIWYQREAYECTVEPDVRVTFDSCLMAMFPGETLTHRMLNDPCRKCLRDTMFILEVKATDSVPHWVTEGVKRAQLTQVPVPKYITGVEKLELHKTTPSGVYL